MKTIVWFALTILAVFVSVQRFTHAVTWGVGLTPDSVNYIEGARNLLKNGEIGEPGAHYPPLYFVLIALSSRFAGDLFPGLKGLHLLALIFVTCLFSSVVWLSSDRSVLPFLVGMILYVTSKTILYIHAMAWSESVFMVFVLLMVLCLHKYFENKEKQTLFLTAAAVSAALSFLTRYAGIVVVVAGMTTLLVFSTGSGLKRLKKSIYFGLIGVVPVVFNWLIHVLSGSAALDRRPVLHLISKQRLRVGIRTFVEWFFLPPKKPIYLLFVLILIVMAYIITSGRNHRRNTGFILEISFVFILIYIPFLIISISLFDAQTPLDDRILYPVYVFLIAGMALLAGRLCRWRKTALLGYPAFVFLLLLATKGYQAQEAFLRDAQRNGIEFAGKKWLQSDMMDWIKRLPPDAIIYSNGPDAVKIITGRPCRWIPRLFSPIDRRWNKNFDREFQRMAADLASGRGIIVYFNQITWRWYLPKLEHIGHALKLEEVYKGSDGIAVKLSGDRP